MKWEKTFGKFRKAYYGRPSSHRASSDTGMKLKELEFLYEIRGMLKIYYLLLDTCRVLIGT